MSADLTPGAPRPRLIDVLAGHDGVLLDAYGVLVDASARRWDLAIVVRVRDLAGWEVLAARPAVAALMRDLEARAEVVKAWTFTVE